MNKFKTESRLNRAITRFLTHKRALGHRYRQEAWLLQRLGRFVEKSGRRDLEANCFARWLTSLRDRHRKVVGLLDAEAGRPGGGEHAVHRGSHRLALARHAEAQEPLAGRRPESLRGPASLRRRSPLAPAAAARAARR